MSEPPDLESLARRFLDLWQDQMTAMAGDPEMAEIMTRLLAMGAPGLAAFMPLADRAAAGAAGMQGPGDEENSDRDTSIGSGKRKSKTAAGAAAAPASPGGGGLDLDELARRLADVESRLARLEAGAGRGGAGRKPRRRSP